MASHDEGYAPMFWLAKWKEADSDKEHETAAGYAHLAFILCQQVCSTWGGDAVLLNDNCIDDAIKICRASQKYDGKNLAENEHQLYFEGLKLIACRNLLCSLMEVGCYQDCQALVEFITNQENWKIELPDHELSRLNDLNRFYIERQAEHVDQYYASKTYIRSGNEKTWRSPYDIDTSNRENMKRFNNFLEYRNVEIIPFSEDVRQDPQPIQFVRDKHGKPNLIATGFIAEGTVILQEQTRLAVSHNNGNAEANTCDWCHRPLRLTEDESKITEADELCCEWSRTHYCSLYCYNSAREKYHVCVVDEEEEENFQRKFDGRSVKDFGYATLLIRRLIRLCKKSTEDGIPMYPLQYDVIPYLPTTSQRLIPWGYKTGIVEPIEMLLNEGINPFTDPEWDFRNITVLWRKLGPIDFHVMGIEFEESSTYDNAPLAGFTALFPTASLLTHSCDPNAEIEINPECPYFMSLTAVKNIEAFETITVSRIYWNRERDPLDVRRRAFAAIGFDRPCECEWCMLDLQIRSLEQIKVKPITGASFLDHYPEAERRAHKEARENAIREEKRKELLTARRGRIRSRPRKITGAYRIANPIRAIRGVDRLPKRGVNSRRGNVPMGPPASATA
ncbi:hypothetical protein DFH27DRAFT_651630 [Peziza echinospora]|nr:hypothetical protein DFH27DRAFT_651630 [Peziza echinospora]